MCLRTLQLECWNCISYFLPPPGLATNSAKKGKKKVIEAGKADCTASLAWDVFIMRIRVPRDHAGGREQELSLMDEIG